MIYNYLVNLRNVVINILNKRILLVEKGNNIIDNKYYLFFINILYNLKLLNLFYSNYKIIYNIDNLIFYDDNIKHDFKLRSVILKFTINDVDYTTKIKQYNINIPVYIFKYLEKIENGGIIYIKTLKGQKTMKIDEIKSKYLYEVL